MKTKLKKNESVVLVIRPHWLILVLPVTLTIAAIAAGVWIGSYGLLLPLIPLFYLAYTAAQRNNNIWVVTNLRVIDEFGFLSQNSKESPLDKINNVTYKQTIWGRIFGYGDVQIQTAAEIGSTVYHRVERPKELKDTITRMQEEYKESQIRSQARELAHAMTENQKGHHRADVAAELEQLFELKQKGILTEEEFAARKKKMLDI